MPNQNPTMPDLGDPVLLSMATQIANAAILSVQKAVAHHVDPAQYLIGDSDSLEARFQVFFEQLPADRQQAAVANAMPIITADQQTRISAYGDLGKIDLRAADPIFGQALAMADPRQFAELPVEDIVAALIADDLQQTQLTLPSTSVIDGGLRPQQAANVLTLSVDQIHCDKVTGWVGVADDDIYLGGVAIDTLGTVQTIDPFEVGSFGRGDTKGGRNPFASFAIETQTNWPKSYSVILVLAEKHYGGIYDYVYTLADKAKAYLVEALTATVGAYIGGIVGSAYPVLGTFIGAVVGWVIGWVLGKVWTYLKDKLFGDDIFAPMTMPFSLPGPGVSWSGSLNSPPIVWDLTGFWGEYHVNAGWHLTWGAPKINACWRTAWDVGHWQGWQSLGGVINFDPAVASQGVGRLDLFAVALDHSLVHASYHDNNWHGWEALGGILTSGPAAVSWGPDRIDVVARGKDNAIWYRFWDGTNWSAWQSLGGDVISPPALASQGVGQLDLFAVGLNKSLVHASFHDNNWHGWESLGGILTSGPAAVSWGPGRIDVVARGTDNAPWYRFWDGTNWSAWKSLGGTINYRPALSSWGVGRLDLFSVGLDKSLVHAASDDGQWHGWASLGGGLTSGPTAVSWGPDHIEIMARGY